MKIEIIRLHSVGFQVTVISGLNSEGLFCIINVLGHMVP